MKSVVLAFPADWAGWRAAVRGLIGVQTPPDQVVWSVGSAADLFAEPPAPDGPRPAFSLPRPLVELAETVIMARDPERFGLLYGLVWRACHGEKHLLDLATDPAVQRAQRLAQSVRRDIHKMRAFLRFREVSEAEATRYVAWFEPDHHILEANAPFFVRRFATMVWSILTPERSAHWTGESLYFGPGAAPSEVPDDDRLERYWRAYFSAIFNPARLKVSAMTSEMPRKYWKNLPEARAIPELIRLAGERTSQMIERAPTEPRKSPLPPLSPPRNVSSDPLVALAAEAAACRACRLWEPATQTVFGEGPRDARIMLVGEQPGDQEDLAGRPFVGPAGQLLDRALAEAGLDRRQLYITNAVKHFKFVPRGKRRIHEKPNAGDIAACRFWLQRERAALNPRLIVAMGATAARAVLGHTVSVTSARGPAPLEDGSPGFVTVHPSFLLRIPDEPVRQQEYALFVADFKKVAELAGR